MVFTFIPSGKNTHFTTGLKSRSWNSGKGRTEGEWSTQGGGSQRRPWSRWFPTHKWVVWHVSVCRYRNEQERGVDRTVNCGRRWQGVEEKRASGYGVEKRSSSRRWTTVWTDECWRMLDLKKNIKEIKNLSLPRTRVNNVPISRMTTPMGNGFVTYSMGHPRNSWEWGKSGRGGKPRGSRTIRVEIQVHTGNNSTTNIHSYIS